MDCKNFETFIYSYIDGELSESDRLNMELHMKECQSCRSLLIYEESFKSAIKKNILPCCAPASLKENIFKKRKSSSQFSLIELLKTPKFYTTATAVTILLLFISPSFMGYTTIIEENRDDFESPMEVFSTNEIRLSKWLSINSSQNLPPLKYKNSLKMTPMGAFVQRDKKTPLMFYHYRGEKVLYKKVEIEPNLSKFKKISQKDADFFIKQDGEFYFVFWKNGKNIYSLTTPLPIAQVNELIDAIETK
ncbi:zf-HC2 domain-containing protein [bacterium]|nr:zf-HC2 domain-containing protein [bacterium]